jgi:hypothetical protein
MPTSDLIQDEIYLEDEANTIHNLTLILIFRFKLGNHVQVLRLKTILYCRKGISISIIT